MNYITNAISLNMFPEEIPVCTFKVLTEEEVREELRQAPFISGIGHSDLAAIVSTLVGEYVPCNRVNVEIKPGDTLIVAQYMGPRLPEGATMLPEGATVRFVKASFIWSDCRCGNCPCITPCPVNCANLG